MSPGDRMICESGPFCRPVTKWFVRPRAPVYGQTSVCRHSRRLRSERQTPHRGSPRAHLHVVGMLTPFFSSGLEPVSVFTVLSTVFHSINSPDNSSLSHSVLPVVFFCLIGPFNYLFMEVYFNPDKVLCGRMGLKHILTN